MRRPLFALSGALDEDVAVRCRAARVVLLEQQPAGLVLAGLAASAAPASSRPSSFSPASRNLKAPLRCRSSASPIGAQVPRVPDDHRAAAILALRDHALEVDVVDRVVLGLAPRSACRPGRARGPSAPPSFSARRRARAAGRNGRRWHGACGRRSGRRPAPASLAGRLGGAARSRASCGSSRAGGPSRHQDRAPAARSRAQAGGLRKSGSRGTSPPAARSGRGRRPSCGSGPRRSAPRRRG